MYFKELSSEIQAVYSDYVNPRRKCIRFSYGHKVYSPIPISPEFILDEQVQGI